MSCAHVRCYAFSGVFLCDQGVAAIGVHLGPDPWKEDSNTHCRKWVKQIAMVFTIALPARPARSIKSLANYNAMCLEEKKHSCASERIQIVLSYRRT